MKPIKVLNLYACLGGNRYKWDEVADIEVTAVEVDPELARLYKERFPNDTVIVADAHQYLLNHFKEYDFIWSSPPCPTHSKVRVSQKNRQDFIFKFPDLKLYEEVIFLDNFFDGKYVIENVIPYYPPLIPAQKRGRHLYWANFRLPNSLNERKQPKDFIMTGSKPNENFHEIDLSDYKGSQRKDKIARNLVDYQAGKTIFEEAVRLIKNKPMEQVGLFSQLETANQ
jgi:DNA (cytosine-5)-methyltransferase 1